MKSQIALVSLIATLCSVSSSVLADTESLTPNQRINIYLNAWEEEDATVRINMLRQAVSENLIYSDRSTNDAGLIINNVEDLNQWIGNFQNSIKSWGLWPVNVSVASNIDINTVTLPEQVTLGRFRWDFRSFSNSYLWAEGDDFVSFNGDGYMTSITGFLGDLTHACRESEWQQGVYVGGDKVSYNGANWQAKWWTDTAPGEELSDTESTWINLGACHSSDS